MVIEYGSGGWVRCHDEDLPGPLLYLRFGLDKGARPNLLEVYLDGDGHELTASLLREIAWGSLVPAVISGEIGWLEQSLRQAAVPVAVLASHFSTSFGRSAKGWVADAWRSQFPNAEVKPVEKLRPRRSSPAAPVSLAAPQEGLTDAFLQDVARAYGDAVARGLRPANALAAQAGVSPRTVHRWVYEARKRGVMPKTTQGRMA